MQYNFAIHTAFALLALVSATMAATITGFAGADCSGPQGQSFNIGPNQCFSLGGGSTKSISYTGVPNTIQFFISGGAHDSCTNGAFSNSGPGSGCGTAPDGVNWESVAVF